MNKTKKQNKNRKGGKVLASGGFGCVFTPSLKCQGKNTRASDKVSKLMINKYAKQEHDLINSIKLKLHNIPNYSNYFLIYDVDLCKPDILTKSDLAAFKSKCVALPKHNITAKNINTQLDNVMILNIPNGGIPIDTYIYQNAEYNKIYHLNNQLLNLLINGIIPMNQKNIYHSDIKDSNVLIGDDQLPKLIDWGLSVEYNPVAKTALFPHNWKNRPLQFNTPFSIVIFTDLFYKKYTEYLKNGGTTDEVNLQPFVIEYLNEWFKLRGIGHYQFINEIIYMLNYSDFIHIPDEKRAETIELTITKPIIINYIVNVLANYTHFKQDGSLDLRVYLNEIYVQIVDIWGFLCIYFPLINIMFVNYSYFGDSEKNIFKMLKNIYNKYLYNFKFSATFKKDLTNDLNKLGKMIHKLTPNTNTHHSKTTSSSSSFKLNKTQTRKK